MTDLALQEKTKHKISEDDDASQQKELDVFPKPQIRALEEEIEREFKKLGIYTPKDTLTSEEEEKYLAARRQVIAKVQSRQLELLRKERFQEIEREQEQQIKEGLEYKLEEAEKVVIAKFPVLIEKTVMSRKELKSLSPEQIGALADLLLEKLISEQKKLSLSCLLFCAAPGILFMFGGALIVYLSNQTPFATFLAGIFGSLGGAMLGYMAHDVIYNSLHKRFDWNAEGYIPFQKAIRFLRQHHGKFYFPVQKLLDSL